ncbi:hypothetical protein PIB30_070190 [Stylosanthes scabra]|uniref:Uncharacterized protein n=1 Tax=Stylosanthes scabra TaxID=79078 RepID=A0ABU6RPL4_9FABA|nr:hypothetical protein [Stylosanthes scabra]
MGAWSRCPTSGIKSYGSVDFLSDLPHQKRIILCSVGELFVVAWLLLCCCNGTCFKRHEVVIGKFDGRMFFGLWQVQVKDVLIQSGLHKTRKVWALSRWSKFGKGPEVADVASLAEGYDDIL